MYDCGSIRIWDSLSVNFATESCLTNWCWILDYMTLGFRQWVYESMIVGLDECKIVWFCDCATQWQSDKLNWNYLTVWPLLFDSEYMPVWLGVLANIRWNVCLILLLSDCLINWVATVCLYDSWCLTVSIWLYDSMTIVLCDCYIVWLCNIATEWLYD